MKIRKFGLALGLAAVSAVAASLMIGSEAFAATRVWTGQGADNNFSTAANWQGGVAPVDGDDLVFDGAATPNSGTVRTEPVNDGLLDSVGNVRFRAFSSATRDVRVVSLGHVSVLGDITSDGTSNDFRVEGNITLGEDVTVDSVEVLGALNLAGHELSLSAARVTGAISGDGTVNIGQNVSFSGSNGYTGITNINHTFAFSAYGQPVPFGTSAVNLNNARLQIDDLGRNINCAENFRFENALNANSGAIIEFNKNERLGTCGHGSRTTLPNVAMTSDLILNDHSSFAIDRVYDFTGILQDGFAVVIQTTNLRTQWIGLNDATVDEERPDEPDPDEGNTDGGNVPLPPNTAAGAILGNPLAILGMGGASVLALGALTCRRRKAA